MQQWKVNTGGVAHNIDSVPKVEVKTWISKV